MTRTSPLSPSDRALLAAFVAAVTEARPQVRRALARAIRAGSPEPRVREAVRMVHLFGGFPRTLTALDALAEATDGRPRAARATDRVRPGAGRAAFDRIYGRHADAVRAELRRLDADVARWIAEHAYARVLARPGLAPAMRELLAVAALGATRQDRPLVSHVLGARRCGASAPAVRVAFAIGARKLAGKERARLARRIEDALSSG